MTHKESARPKIEGWQKRFESLPIPRDFKRGQVELLLESFGGAASLGDFMRRLDTIRGCQRVGRIVRKSLQSEIAALRRKGKVTIEDGMIRLL